MQVVCKSNDEAADVCCSVCGQGFELTWERQSKTERVEALRAIAKTLREHHERDAGREAHPQPGFAVRFGDGASAFSGAAMLGSVPSWAL